MSTFVAVVSSNTFAILQIPNTRTVIFAGREQQISVFVNANASQGTRMPL